VRFNSSLSSGSSPFGTLIAEVLGGGITADVLVQALEEKGLARRLAEPNLIALSGERASFLAGGEVPIPVSSDDNRISVDYKEYGVRLNFTPVVLDDGLINLKLEPEVSQVDESVRVSTGAISVPSFITRRASTSIEVRDGQSFAMAGLLQTTHTKNQEQLPWLGQLPVIGALFRSSGFQEQETDLVIIVTPRLVKPAKPGQPLRTPLDGTKPSNDVEFFLMGSLEVDSGMQKRFAEGEGVIGPYGHIVNLQPEKRNVSKKITRKY
jgi:pilus assembly protein CpaC